MNAAHQAQPHSGAPAAHAGAVCLVGVVAGQQPRRYWLGHHRQGRLGRLIRRRAGGKWQPSVLFAIATASEREARAVLGQALAALDEQLPVRGDPVIPRHRQPDRLWVATLRPDLTHLREIEPDDAPTRCTYLTDLFPGGVTWAVPRETTREPGTNGRPASGIGSSAQMACCCTRRSGRPDLLHRCGRRPGRINHQPGCPPGTAPGPVVDRQDPDGPACIDPSPTATTAPPPGHGLPLRRRACEREPRAGLIT